MAMKNGSKLVWFLVGIILILVGSIVFLIIEWESQHLKDNWANYAGAVMGSGGLISILPTLIEAVKTKNLDIILKDINKLYELIRRTNNKGRSDTTGKRATGGKHKPKPKQRDSK